LEVVDREKEKVELETVVLFNDQAELIRTLILLGSFGREKSADNLDTATDPRFF
jgi:hypothetical protein